MRTITAEDVRTRALTGDEKGWLRDRDRHGEVDLNEEIFGREVVEGSGELQFGTGPATVGGTDEDEGDDYENWKKQELIDEGAGREPAVDFTGCNVKADYVAALRAWDVAHPEDDDTKE